MCDKRGQSCLEAVSNRKSFTPESGQGRVTGGNVLGEEKVRVEQKAEGCWQGTCPPLGRWGRRAIGLTAHLWSQLSSGVDIEVQDANWDNRNHARYIRQREFNAENWLHGNRKTRRPRD